MLIRSRAPLRISLAGGGTDVSPYCDLYGGSILNATVSMYAYATIEPTRDGEITLNSIDQRKTLKYEAVRTLPLNGELDLLKGVYNRVMKQYNMDTIPSFSLTTYVDAPPGSGLGSSSTLCVAVLAAFSEWLGLPLGEYDIAHMAYEIERLELGMAGGKQDQYAAAFGGFNFMEFYAQDKVVVNPLRIKPEIVNELQMNILLYYTGTSRLSCKIIENQIENVQVKRENSLLAMHNLKEQASLMKEAILRGKLDEVGDLLDKGWNSKKQMAEGITNNLIEDIYKAAKAAGATGGKISGAGGGGFFMFFCPRNTRYKVIEALQKYGGEFRRYQFTKKGVETWRIVN